MTPTRHSLLTRQQRLTRQRRLKGHARCSTSIRHITPPTLWKDFFIHIATIEDQADKRLHDGDPYRPAGQTLRTH
jgi:hypothetical protein